MTFESWKDRAGNNLSDLKLRMSDYGARTVEGLLAGIVLWQYIEAYRENDMAAVKTFYRIESELQLGQLIDIVDRWSESVSDEQQLVLAIEQEVKAQPELRGALDRLLEKLDITSVALERANGDRGWLMQTLKDELTHRGEHGKVEHLIRISAEKNFGLIIGAQTINYYNADGENEGQKELKALGRYLHGLRQYCLQLPLTSLGMVNQSDKRVTLSQIYIALNTTTKVNPDGTRIESFEDQVSGADETRLLPIMEAIEDERFCIIIGDPGSGKSTFVKHYLAEQCYAFNEGNPLPILISLRAFAALLRQIDLPEDWQARQGFLVDQVIAAARDEHSRILDDSFVDTFEKYIRTGNCVLAFDGMDEVPVNERILIRSAIGALLEQLEPPKKLIVTCRVRSYHGEAVFNGSSVYTLSPLTQEQMELFSTAWYEAMAQSGGIRSEFAKEQSADMISALREPTIGSLGENPMLLTTLAIIHEQTKQLLKQRVILYDRAIDILLMRWDGSRMSLENAAGRDLVEFLNDNMRIRPTMQQLAYMAHDPTDFEPGSIDGGDLDWREAISVLQAALGGSLDLAQNFLKYIDERSGLLICQGEVNGLPSRYSFVHRTFQEYLAGCFLLKKRDLKFVRCVQGLAEHGEYWGLAVQLAGEELYYRRQNENRLLDLASSICPKEVTSEVSARLALWAGHFAALVKPELIRANEDILDGGGDALLSRLKRLIQDAMKSELPAPERTNCGDVLYRLGDPREEVMTVEGMQFCYVPSGIFMMGDEPQEVDVPYAYWIGRYPVSNGQFNKFVKYGGYDEEKYWTKTGWEEKNKRTWKDQHHFGGSFGCKNHPAVGVSWYEADAYVHWLQEFLQGKGILPEGFKVCLLNDPEWEKAARGGVHIPKEPIIASFSEIRDHADLDLQVNTNPVRRFAWGSDEPSPKYMNYEKSEIGSTTPIGCYPGGASPYGAEELNGQVWEWLRSYYQVKYQELAPEEWRANEPRESDQWVVWRGGSYTNSGNISRSTRRYYVSRAYHRYDAIGFRLVLKPV